MKILVVDDSAVNRKQVIDSIPCGHEILEASDGSEALPLLDGVDLLITDKDMPEMGGIELMRNMRDKNIPVILCSPTFSSKNMQDAFDLGAIDLMYKPYNEIHLKGKMKGLVSLMEKALEK